MLLYEKIVDEERKIFGAANNVPDLSDTSTDVEATYKDGDDKTITVTRADSLFDAGGGSMKKADGTIVNVWVGTDNVIPGDLEEGTSTDSSLHGLKVILSKVSYSAVISESASPKTAVFTLPSGTNLATLKPIADINMEATISPACNGKTVMDLSDSKTVNVTVTAEDGTTTSTYTVSATTEA